MKYRAKNLILNADCKTAMFSEIYNVFSYGPPFSSKLKIQLIRRTTYSSMKL